MCYFIAPQSGVVSGIERWTDGLKWGPSRVRDDFLFYQEKDSNERDTAYVTFLSAGQVSLVIDR